MGHKPSKVSSHLCIKASFVPSLGIFAAASVCLRKKQQYLWSESPDGEFQTRPPSLIFSGQDFFFNYCCLFVVVVALVDVVAIVAGNAVAVAVVVVVVVVVVALVVAVPCVAWDLARIRFHPSRQLFKVKKNGAANKSRIEQSRSRKFRKKHSIALIQLIWPYLGLV